MTILSRRFIRLHTTILNACPKTRTYNSVCTFGLAPNTLGSSYRRIYNHMHVQGFSNTVNESATTISGDQNFGTEHSTDNNICVSSSQSNNQKETEVLDYSRKVDLRVGVIDHVEKHPDADLLYVLSVNVGEHLQEPEKEIQRRTIVSGLVKHYTPDQLLHKRVIVFANMKPRKLRGILSQGMLLAASSPNDKQPYVEVLEAPSSALPGDRVSWTKPEPMGNTAIGASMSTKDQKPLVKKQKIIEGFLKSLTLESAKAKFNNQQLYTERGDIISTRTLTSGRIN